MDIQTIVIVLLVVALVVGPIKLIQPSRRDRYQQALRDSAFKRGLRVSLETPPRLPTDSNKPEPTPKYCLPRQYLENNDYWRLIRAAYAHDTHFARHWCWSGPPAPAAVQARLEGLIAHLPESVLAVGAGSQGCYVYWTEQGGEPVLDEIDRFLRQL